MRNNVLSYLLLPLFASLSFSLSAAPANTAAVAEPVPIVSQQQVQQPQRLDLNKADALTLQKELNGIGKAKAEAIVAYREEHGGFKNVEELLEVSGIGPAKLAQLKDQVHL